MELSKIIKNTKEILEIDDIFQMQERLMQVCLNHEIDIYNKFCEMVENDLSVDYLQKIFQYWMADRKEKMQDYTPKSIAELMGRLSGESKTIIDMCAGSGALSIQKWNLDKDISFILYEIDEKVLPLLIFNMCVRNISCTIIHGDVLQLEEFKRFQVIPGERFAECKEVACGNISNFKSTI